MTINNDRIEIGQHGGVTFVGRDAVSLYQAVALRVAIKTYARSGLRMNRAWTPSAMLTAAGRITGKTYKRGQHETAAADLNIWIETMRAALPIETKGDNQ